MSRRSLPQPVSRCPSLTRSMSLAARTSHLPASRPGRPSWLPLLRHPPAGHLRVNLTGRCVALGSDLGLEPVALRLQPINLVRDQDALRLEPGRLRGAGRSSFRALPLLLVPGRLGSTGSLVLGGMLRFLPAALLLGQAGRLRLGGESIALFDGKPLTLPGLVELNSQALTLGGSGNLRRQDLLRPHGFMVDSGLPG